MILRKATLHDLDLLTHWDRQPHVIACDPSELGDWKEELTEDYDWQQLLISEVDDEPIGFLQVIDPAKEETHYWGDVPSNLRALDIWIGEAYNLSKGYGTMMMKMAFDKCFSDPKITAILIDPLKSNTNAHRFYERLGFEFVEERTFEQDVCFVYELTRSQWLEKHIHCS